MVRRAPDSQLGDDRRVEAVLTDEYDFPQHGSVTLRIWYSKSQSSTLKISRAEAEELARQIAALPPEVS